MRQLAGYPSCYNEKNKITKDMEKRKESEAVEQESRKVGRISYAANGVIVVCDTQEKYYVQVQNVSPLGIGVQMPPESPKLLGKDVIIVTETLIMYADVVRQDRQEDGSYSTGISAKRFTDDVLAYLFENITGKENQEESE